MRETFYIKYCSPLSMIKVKHSNTLKLEFKTNLLANVCFYCSILPYPRLPPAGNEGKILQVFLQRNWRYDRRTHCTTCRTWCYRNHNKSVFGAYSAARILALMLPCLEDVDFYFLTGGNTSTELYGLKKSIHSNVNNGSIHGKQ